MLKLMKLLGLWALLGWKIGSVLWDGKQLCAVQACTSNMNCSLVYYNLIESTSNSKCSKCFRHLIKLSIDGACRFSVVVFFLDVNIDECPSLIIAYQHILCLMGWGTATTTTDIRESWNMFLNIKASSLDRFMGLVKYCFKLPTFNEEIAYWLCVYRGSFFMTFIIFMISFGDAKT